MENCFPNRPSNRIPRREGVPEPDYDTFQTSTIVTEKQVKAPGELHWPYRVAIDEATHHIFVANYSNGRVEIFSETGEYICQLGVGQLFRPWGIAIHGDSVYVSCWGDTISKFSPIDMSLGKRIGGMGSNNGQFVCPSQLTTDPIGRVFIALPHYPWKMRVCVRSLLLLLGFSRQLCH